MGRLFSLDYVADCLQCSRPQLDNMIGSGKVCVQLWRGQRRVAAWEIQRLEVLRGADRDCYAVWDGTSLRWINNRYAARLTNCSQDALVDAAHRKDVTWRRIGNTLEFDVQSLGRWYGQRYRGGPVAWDLVADPLGQRGPNPVK